METKIAGREGIPLAAEIIRGGGIVAFPTETVYGLGADAFNETAVKKIFEAKGRPQDNPLIVHAADIESARAAADITDDAARLLEVFSPGPLTLVLRKNSDIPENVTAGLPTVGIRIPKHGIALELLRLAGLIAAPSANASTGISPTSARHVYEDMAGRIPLILDGGQCEVGIESTVLDLTGGVPTVLRPGAVTLEMLLEVLPAVRNRQGEVRTASSPGMKYRHYAPKVECALAVSPAAAKAACVRLLAEGRNPVVIGRSGYFCGERFMDAGNTPRQVAKNIYRLLREAEKSYDFIIIERFSETDLEYSIMNRLTKSTEGRII